MTALFAGGTNSAAAELSAHGIGGQQDLPISLGIAMAGAVAALVISFTVLSIAWRAPRYDDTVRERPVPNWLQHMVDSTTFTLVARGLGLVVFAYTAIVAVFGVDKAINPLFGIFYVWLWVGLVPMSLLLGPFYKTISPVRTINLLFAKLAGTDPDDGLYRYPERLGYWPAALGLFAFVWMELVYPYMAELSPVRLWCAIYLAVMLVGGAMFGNRFYERADPFEVYSSLVGKLSIWGRRDEVAPVALDQVPASGDSHDPTQQRRALVLRSPLANVATVTAAPGLVAVVGVLFGSTGFDSFSGSPTWIGYLQGTQVSGYLLNNLALIAFCAGASAVFALGCVLTGVGPDQRRWALPDALAHSIIPIIVGYMVAHYLTYFVEIGSRTLMLASDPLSTGADILGTAKMSPFVWFSYHPTLLANIKVLAIVAGHILAAVVAHDRAIKLLPARHHLIGQIPLLIAMVGFTSGGLYLLFSA